MSLLAMEVQELQDQIKEKMDCTTELYGNPELKRQELQNCQKYMEEIQSQIQKSINQEKEIEEEISTMRA